MNITLTEAARTELKRELEAGHHMRLMLKRTGCCGVGIALQAWKAVDGDLEMLVVGFPVAVDRELEASLKDISIDFKRWGFSREFKVIPM